MLTKSVNALKHWPVQSVPVEIKDNRCDGSNENEPPDELVGISFTAFKTSSGSKGVQSCGAAEIEIFRGTTGVGCSSASLTAVSCVHNVEELRARIACEKKPVFESLVARFTSPLNLEIIELLCLVLGTNASASSHKRRYSFLSNEAILRRNSASNGYALERRPPLLRC